MRLSEAGWDNYRHLTRSATFYAVDTEYTSAAKTTRSAPHGSSHSPSSPSSQA